MPRKRALVPSVSFTLIAVAALTTGQTQAAAPSYHLALLSVPGATSVSVSDINDAGQAVGSYTDDDFYRHAVFWDADGTPHTLAVPIGPEVEGLARAINNNGQITGTATDPDFGAVSAVLWNVQTPDQYILISSVAGEAATPADISDSGAVVGGRSGYGTGAPSHAFVWTAADGFVDYGIPDEGVTNQQARWSAVNASGRLVGHWNVSFTTIHATVGQLGTPTVLPMSSQTEAFPSIAGAINSSGTAVGLGLAEATPKLVPVVFDGDGFYTEIPGATLDQDNGAATAINDAGTIVGTAGIGTANGIVPGLRGWVHVDGVTYNLLDVVDDASAFSRFSNGVAINTSGVIVGTGRLLDESVASFVLTPSASDAIFVDGFDSVD